VLDSIVDFLGPFLRNVQPTEPPSLSLTMGSGPSVNYETTKDGPALNGNVIMSNCPAKIFTTKSQGGNILTLYKFVIRNNGYAMGECRRINEHLRVLDPCSGFVSCQDTGMGGILHFLSCGADREKDRKRRFSKVQFEGGGLSSSSSSSAAMGGTYIPLLSVNSWSGNRLSMDEATSPACFGLHLRTPPLALPDHPQDCACNKFERALVGAMQIVRALSPMKCGNLGTSIASHQVL